VVISVTGWTAIDRLLSLFIGALILVSSLRLLREALRGLMEGAPFNGEPEAVGGELAGLPGVASVHDLHIWSVAADRPLLTAHLAMRDIAAWESVMEASHALVDKRFGIRRATLQPESMTRTLHRLGKPAPKYGHGP